MSASELALDLGESIRDTINTYITGHDIPIELVVGVLHCIAHEMMIDHREQIDAVFEEMDEDADDEFPL